MSASSPARVAAIHYARSSSSSSSENLPPRTLARLAREVRDLHQQPPEGIRMVVDNDTGLPANLGEIMVSESKQSITAATGAWHGPARSPPQRQRLSHIYLLNSDSISIAPTDLFVLFLNDGRLSSTVRLAHPMRASTFC